ncbi:hypothetical protein D8B46_06895 [Candidatus Gracilibacteria bacterium]|nr:MAG: hypothetical protein D8B46_06895 [Candidatus Gracilibacteria bacterium]
MEIVHLGFLCKYDFYHLSLKYCILVLAFLSDLFLESDFQFHYLQLGFLCLLSFKPFFVLQNLALLFH